MLFLLSFRIEIDTEAFIEDGKQGMEAVLWQSPKERASASAKSKKKNISTAKHRSYCSSAVTFIYYVDLLGPCEVVPVHPFMLASHSSSNLGPHDGSVKELLSIRP